MKPLRALLLSLLSGLLLYAAWPSSPLSFLIFFAFLPLLWLETYCRRRSRFFLWAWLSLLTWNAATTWWMCNASFPGGISAIVANALLMSIPWIGFFNVKKRFGPKIGYASLVVFWMSFEYIHLNWELSWPWLTLGNAFAGSPGWIQWYEYTGTSGGSLWILLANLAAFFLLQKILQGLPFRKPAIFLALVIALPLALSFLILKSSEKSLADGLGKTNVVVVQPNVDPWNEKFVAGSEENQLNELLRLSAAAIDSQTALVVWPETAIPIPLDEDSLLSKDFLRPIWAFLHAHPHISLFTGIEGYRIFNERNKTEESERIGSGSLYYERYNSAVVLWPEHAQVYHKSRLVPGAEVLPSFIRFLSTWFEKFGGTTGSYVKQKARTVLFTKNKEYTLAPAICYESIFGEFMAEYVRNGADLIAIGTNDGWWGDTEGYRQHALYARLRAIETRRWVVRSANTGISCFIDPLGRVIDAQPWNKKTAIKYPVPLLTGRSFFVGHGDLLSRILLLAAILLVIVNLSTLLYQRLSRGRA